MSTKIQVRRDTAANWASANPVLLRGEIAFEYDTKKVKIGDGILAWNSLPYSLVSQAMVQELIDAHANLTNNPHAVTKAQVGLGNADNTSDVNKPVSAATQTALDLKASLTYVDSGLSIKANTSDVYTKTQSNSTFEPKNANIQSHISNTDNPHSVTKSQVGLGNVDNTSDANKPVSTATQAALDLKASLTYVDTGLSGKADLDGSGKVPVSQLPNSVMEYKGAYNPVTNIPALADGTGNAGDVYRISAAGSKDFGSGSITFFAGDFIIYSGSVWERSPLADGVVSVNGYQGAVSLTKSDVGLGNVPNVDATARANHTGTQLASTISDFNTAADARVSAGISAHTAALDPHPQYETSAEAQAKVDAHANRVDNPHSTTKAQVGLGNVDNTSDASKPISTATQSALDLKASLTYVDTGLSTKADVSSVYTKTQSDANFEPKNANIQSHIASLSNPHNVTKAQVGLDNVPNVDATLRSNHTGTQLAATISDFTTAVQAVTIDAAKIDGGNVSNLEFSYLDGVTSSIQTQLDGKQATITGAATTVTTSNLTASRALASDVSGKIAASAVTSTELGYVSGVTSAIQTQLDSKQATITGGATTITASNLTINRALASDASGKVAVSTVTSTELGYVSGVTSAIQTQLNAKRSILGTQVLTTGTAYTPTAGTNAIRAVLVGAGGGGGGVTGATNSVGAASGGGSGAVLEVFAVLPGAASYTIAIGTAGLGGTAGANNGTAGTATTLTIGATTYSAAGGSGGTAQTAGTAVAYVLGGAGAAQPTTGQVNIPGTVGGYSIRNSGTLGISGKGADCPYGAGGAALLTAAAGSVATGFGSGGGGALSTANANRAGGNGAPGIIIITEYT